MSYGSTLVSIIIPVWNLWDMTSACLQSLAEHTAGEHVEIIVVDNHSTDATSSKLENFGKSLFGTAFNVVHMSENAGFARGCNAGAAVASGDLLFFLNNDTKVTPGWLPPLREAMADRRLGAVGPLLLYPDNTVQHCGIIVTPFRQVEHLYEHLPAQYIPAHKKHPLKAITGAALLLHKKDFHACGGFCEAFVNGFEDIDLCCSLYRRGLALRVEARSVIYHHTSQTPGRFLHNKNNSMLLHQRQGNILFPDQHVLAAQDGYELHIGPTLLTWLSVPAERQQEYTAAVNKPTFNVKVCHKLLEHEPLWRDGWFLLANYLEKKGRAQEALQVLMSHWWLFPEERTYVALQHLHTIVYGCPNTKVETLLRGVHEADLAANAAVVHEARSMALDRRDVELVRLYDTWLARYAPEGGTTPPSC